MNKRVARVTIGAGLIAGVAGLLFADVGLAVWAKFPYAPCFWTLLVGALLVGGHEFFKMLRRQNRPCRPIIGMVFVVLMVAAVFAETQFQMRLRSWLYERGLEMYLLIFIALVFTTYVAEIIRVERSGRPPAEAMEAVGWTLVGVLTVGLLGVFLAKIRFLRPDPGGPSDPMRCLMYLMLTLGVVKIGDIGAYAVGSTYGHHKLVPTLSPAKSVEGLVGALVFGIVAALLIGLVWGGYDAVQMVVFGGVVSMSGVFGDLAESLMKRACGVKDSGPIPGFGGALDILDSMLSAAPVAYLLLMGIEAGAILTGAPAGG